MKTYYVYIVTNKPYGTLYIGVTNDITLRMYEHKNNIVSGFTSTYHLHQLVHLEESTDINAALQREKTMKRWPRQWKLNVINEHNPHWNDLAQELTEA